MQEQLDQAIEEKKKAESERDKVVYQLNSGKEQHEQEVSLRLKFEEKLNNLHSLNRTFQQLAEKNSILLAGKKEELQQFWSKYDKSLEQLSSFKAQTEILEQWKLHAEKSLIYKQSVMEKTKLELDETNKSFFKLQGETTNNSRDIRDKS